MADRLEGLGYAVMQVSDRDFRRPIGCDHCGMYDTVEPRIPWRTDDHFVL
mgnify:CR=1 FL=1